MDCYNSRMKKTRVYSPATIEASRLLGSRIRLARSERRWTVRDLADRVGIAKETLQKVERGDPTVGLGVAFEAATLVGVPLFDEDRSIRQLESRRVNEYLALMPQRIRKPVKVDDDF